MCTVSQMVVLPFSLAIVLSEFIRFTDSVYPFGIFKFFIFTPNFNLYLTDCTACERTTNMKLIHISVFTLYMQTRGGIKFYYFVPFSFSLYCLNTCNGKRVRLECGRSCVKAPAWPI